jgi:hypothetical protein
MTGKQFATILVITFIVGLIWLVSDILFNVKPSVPVNPQLNTLLQPINPNFDPRVLEMIENEVVTPDLRSLPSRQPAPSVSPQPSPSPRSTTSPSPSPRATSSPLSATQSGQIFELQ